MRIGLDARSIGERVCGVSRTTLRIIESLSKLDGVNHYFVFINSELQGLRLGPNFKIINTGCSRMNPFSDIKFSKSVAALELDVFHSIHSWLPFHIGLSRARKIITLHDVFAITDPEFFSKYGIFKHIARWYFLLLITRAVNSADLIATISEYSARKILELFPVAADKLKVVYLAAGMPLVRDGTTESKETAKPYLLYVGNCRSYKNIPVLIKGFAAYLKKNPDSDLSLVVAGNDSSPAARSLVDRSGVSSRVIFIDNSDDKTLNGLYIGALAFILPSKEEGFGIPALEAMERGIPVIISDADALVEVAKDAALVFHRDSPDQLAVAIDTLVRDPNLRKDLGIRGVLRSSAFSWDNTAAGFKSCYEKLPNLPT